MELPGEAASECGNWRQLALTFNRRLLLWFCLVSANGDMQKENLKTKNRKTEQLNNWKLKTESGTRRQQQITVPLLQLIILTVPPAALSTDCPKISSHVAYTLHTHLYYFCFHFFPCAFWPQILKWQQRHVRPT